MRLVVAFQLYDVQEYGVNCSATLLNFPLQNKQVVQCYSANLLLNRHDIFIKTDVTRTCRREYSITLSNDMAEHKKTNDNDDNHNDKPKSKLVTVSISHIGYVRYRSKTSGL